MTGHTSTPWRFSGVRIHGADGHVIVDTYEAGLQPSDARRIVQCVNACEGIPTEALEDGTVGDAIALLHNIKDLADRGNVRPPKPIWEELVRILDRLKDGDSYER